MSVWADIIERDGHEAAVWSGPLTYEESVDHCLARILPHMPDEGVVVDYGCGIGRLTGPLADALGSSAYVVGVDTEPEMIAEAQSRRHFGSNVFFATDTGIDTMPVAGLVCVLVLQHIHHEEQVVLLRRFADALLPGARMALQFAVGEDNVPLSRQWPWGELAGLVGASGVTVISIERDPVFPTWAWVVAEKGNQ